MSALPELVRASYESPATYRERQLVALGATDTTSPTRKEWEAGRRVRGGVECAPECALCWRSELHRRGLELERAAS